MECTGYRRWCPHGGPVRVGNGLSKATSLAPAWATLLVHFKFVSSVRGGHWRKATGSSPWKAVSPAPQGEGLCNRSLSPFPWLCPRQGLFTWRCKSSTGPTGKLLTGWAGVSIPRWNPKELDHVNSPRYVANPLSLRQLRFSKSSHP